MIERGWRECRAKLDAWCECETLLMLILTQLAMICNLYIFRIYLGVYITSCSLYVAVVTSSPLPTYCTQQQNRQIGLTFVHHGIGQLANPGGVAD